MLQAARTGTTPTECHLHNIFHTLRWHNLILTLSQKANSRLSKLQEQADDNYKFDEIGRKFSKRVHNTEKTGNCSLQDWCCRHIKTRACLGKG